ncbi:GtrA family protein [Bariatricus massiliensis]|uniref:GtrA family protein n=1 Tax=Bariatricus massiliensis TaxID=1745713 RepID=A0ABS8DIS2_9FIRM|nr:GtrA family protein [Bariatricus massiliensis]MCB7305195.1 GtrA family protein [Bariatricus massiliensis]MCB7375697.1 GtrA family protein [Bariatricus massiliensis]MCB7388338.1 GtrA family protein [Bariatricus massiliensis]MCB7412459.1 GtrA family protein [Bariatricus massiliensis]MCQ5254147.1 GtrA family protein [Bariatricus massiliensis]
MNDNNLGKQILKFTVVGGSAFVIDYLLLFLCTEFIGMPYYISNIISFSVSVIFNYILSVKWVFDVEDKRNKSAEFVVFIILSVIGLGINQVVMWAAVEYIKIYYMLAKIGATAIVMVYNFISRKMVLEK